MSDTRAPSSFNQHIFFSPASVFYGTDDGYQDGSLTELEALRRFYDGVEPARRDRIHFVSVVGGLYGLNLMTCWRPRRITFFDINPHAIDYFTLIRRLFQISGSRDELLARLSTEDYEVYSPAEAFIRENLALQAARRARSLARLVLQALAGNQLALRARSFRRDQAPPDREYRWMSDSRASRARTFSSTCSTNPICGCTPRTSSSSHTAGCVSITLTTPLSCRWCIQVRCSSSTLRRSAIVRLRCRMRSR